MSKNQKAQKSEQLRQLREKRQQEALAQKQKEKKTLMIIGASALAFILVVVGISVLISSLIKQPEVTTPTVQDLSNEPIKTTLAPTSSYTSSTSATNYVKLNVSYTADNGQRYNGDIVVKLDAESAPITVANFQKLVGEKFYDGLTFHRVIENFMIQGGDPNGNGTGGSDEEIKGEFSANGVDNPIKHERGVISMARSGERRDAYGNLIDTGYDSASSQFFIVHQTNLNSTNLDGKYAAFGHVVFGMETVDGIAGIATGSSDKPLRTVKIESAVFVNYTGSEE